VPVTLRLIDRNGDSLAVQCQVHVEVGETFWDKNLYDGDLSQVTYVYR
jgi:hypothetical protein